MKITEVQVKGYKNLIDCTALLGDFNVIVGPNNSGKSNFLEIFELVARLCLFSVENRDRLFAGNSLDDQGTTIPHAPQNSSMPLEIKLGFETRKDSKKFIYSYELGIQRDCTEKTAGKFIKERFSGKKASKTGVAKVYLKRFEKFFSISGSKKKHPLDSQASMLDAIRVYYPEPKDRLSEIGDFLYLLLDATISPIFALNPQSLRDFLTEEIKHIGFRNDILGLAYTVDKLHEDDIVFSLFRETACNILDLDDIKFQAQDIPMPSADDKKAKKTERIRSLFIQKRGADYVSISECSDGTWMVLAILAAVLSDKDHSLICIEEPENDLHPAALAKLIEFLKDQSSKKQLLITTHSPYLLNCVRPEDVIVALPDENAATVFKKPKDIKKINKLLKSGFMSLGDLLVDNFAEVL